MIAFAHFAIPDTPPTLFRTPNVAVQLIAGSVDTDLGPVTALGPLAHGVGLDDVALLPDPDESALGDLFPAPAAGLGDFNPIGLLLLPLFPLALIPLFVTFAGSLVAFLMDQFSPLPAMADAVAVDPAPGGSLPDAGSLNGLDFNAG